MKNAFSLFIITLMLGVSSINAQTQEFTNEADFLAALGGAAYSLEDYETNCPGGEQTPTLDGFSLSSTNGNSDCFSYNFDCGTEFSNTYNFVTDATLVFNESKNSFGTTLVGAGSAGLVTITLMTETGETYTVVEDFEGEACAKVFFGIISDMDFTMITFNSNNPGDGIGIDDSYCANVAAIPTMSQWALLILGLILTSMAAVKLFSRKDAMA